MVRSRRGRLSLVPFGAATDHLSAFRGWSMVALYSSWKSPSLSCPAKLSGNGPNPAPVETAPDRREDRKGTIVILCVPADIGIEPAMGQ